MVMEFSPIERRAHPRLPIPAGLTVEHAASKRSFPARTADLSVSGVAMFVPPTAPVQAGQEVDITFGWFADDTLGDFATQTHKAIIVRVDREPLLTKGHIEVGARFEA
jgi:hypothetical protein